MTPKVIRGNLFSSTAQTLVNTVNCVGVMGAGIAFEFRLRFPDMYREYVEKCRRSEIRIGKLWLFARERDRWLLNFPTKKHWKYPTKIEYLKSGLESFLAQYAGWGIESIAFPLLGAMHGKIPEDTSLTLMIEYLSRCDIPVEIYRYDPRASDDLFQDFVKRLSGRTAAEISRSTGIRTVQLETIMRAVGDGSVATLSQLIALPGVGEVTVEKCFRFVSSGESSRSSSTPADQLHLFPE